MTDPKEKMEEMLKEQNSKEYEVWNKMQSTYLTGIETLSESDKAHLFHRYGFAEGTQFGINLMVKSLGLKKSAD